MAPPHCWAFPRSLIVLAVLPHSLTAAWLLTIAGISWHLVFSLWHTGTLWQGWPRHADTAPTLYLPTVAGNFTSAAALGALGHADWGWLFLGAGVSLAGAGITDYSAPMASGSVRRCRQRPLLGIQFAPLIAQVPWRHRC